MVYKGKNFNPDFHHRHHGGNGGGNGNGGRRGVGGGGGGGGGGRRHGGGHGHGGGRRVGNNHNGRGGGGGYDSYITPSDNSESESGRGNRPSHQHHNYNPPWRNNNHNNNTWNRFADHPFAAPRFANNASPPSGPHNNHFRGAPADSEVPANNNFFTPNQRRASVCTVSTSSQQQQQQQPSDSHPKPQKRHHHKSVYGHASGDLVLGVLELFEREFEQHLGADNDGDVVMCDCDGNNSNSNPASWCVQHRAAEYCALLSRYYRLEADVVHFFEYLSRTCPPEIHGMIGVWLSNYVAARPDSGIYAVLRDVAKKFGSSWP
ncbi:hypothetical protein F5Y17DRAFT_337341 [Xylariaceae sp. FL0594]|nr:hypothetical protein F5Y17DRAFT_337341 [Xylariaceae sp. FL0594]